jgi:transposase
MLLADRGYDADWIRALAAKRGVWANIPPRCNRNEPLCFSPYLYRARNLVERFFNKIKQCRRVATLRYMGARYACAAERPGGKRRNEVVMSHLLLVVDDRWSSAPRVVAASSIRDC